MGNTGALKLIHPQWPAPSNVHAFATTRVGGASKGPYAGLNLALHVDDSESNVRANRALLRKEKSLPGEPCWLNQVHGVEIHCLDQDCEAAVPVTADASYTTEKQRVCVVMTADCLPLLFCDEGGEWVAAAHGGWRGLLGGVIERVVDQYSKAPQKLMVWMGPAIGPQAFEVGEEVRTSFLQKYSGVEKAFRHTHDDKYLCDIYQLARKILRHLSISRVYGGDYCTYRENKWFYSYRRDPITGRMATLIWMT